MQMSSRPRGAASTLLQEGEQGGSGGKATVGAIGGIVVCIGPFPDRCESLYQTRHMVLYRSCELALKLLGDRR